MRRSAARYLLPGIPFPDPREASTDGLVAVGPELTVERLLEAYARGIFPWFERKGEVFWFCPDPRMVLLPADLHVPRSLARTSRRGRFEVRLDTAFDGVVRRCAEAPRPDGERTWISPAFRRAYRALHELGYAHSAEAWREGQLVGGLYGVSLGGVFFGESMFSQENEASKIAFVHLVRQLDRWGFALIDCQVHTAHLERFGALEWTRSRFLVALRAALRMPTRRGVWRFDAGPAIVARETRST